MRTTLKRGIGRGAGVDGNGRAVLPPATRTPMTLYRQPKRRRRTGLQLVGRILLWLLIAVLSEGRIEWWTERAWMGYALAASIALIGSVGFTVGRGNTSPQWVNDLRDHGGIERIGGCFLRSTGLAGE